MSSVSTGRALSDSGSGSYRRPVGLNPLRQQEDEQRAAGEGEREHRSRHSGPEGRGRAPRAACCSQDSQRRRARGAAAARL